MIRERTATSKTFRNPDGTLTSVIHGRPIHYREGRRWLPIESALVPAAGEYGWRNEGNVFDALFKETLTDGYLRFVTSDDAGFSVDLVGADASATAIAAGDAQPDGSRITYPDAFPGVDLQYDLVADGVKETLVLADAGAPTDYRFLLRPDDGLPVDAHRQRDGSWAFFTPGSPGPAFVLNAPFAFDSAEEAGDTKRHARMEVEERDGEFVVDVSLDTGWFDDPEREFPVFLDPTLTIQPATMDGSFPMGCGSCTPLVHSILHIGANAVETYRAGLAFDLGDPPTMAEVTGAQLKMKYVRMCMNPAGTSVRDYGPGDARPVCGATTQTFDVHRMTDSWSTASTSSQIGYDSVPIATHTLVAGTNRTNLEPWLTWDVTSTVRSWLAGTQPNFGFLVKRDVDALGSGGIEPASRSYWLPEQTPVLEITYVGDAVSLLPPDTLHSDGAELEWEPYAGSAPFQAYEVHRSEVAGFVPSASTLLATLPDRSHTTFRDTTAAPGKAFTYKVTVGSSASNGQRVTLPPDGQATKLLQLEPVRGKGASVTKPVEGTTFCSGNSVRTTLGVSSTVSEGTAYPTRSLLEFDLGDIPAAATISSATMSLWLQDVRGGPVTVDAHPVTRAWNEGGTWCATSATWTDAGSGVPWANAGTDFDNGRQASADVTVSGGPRWTTFDVSSFVDGWSSGRLPNLGVLLKARSEAPETPSFVVDFASDDTMSAALRPKLAISYVDGSKAKGPLVEVSSPGTNAVVSGARTVSVTASDDRRVETVEVFSDGVPVGADSSAPYEIPWATTGTSNGSHTLTVKATDDAGNVTTSNGVAVTVQNSAPPTTAVSAPAAGAVVKQAVSFTATATDDMGVQRVEFFVDGNRIGLPDTTSPYGVSWNTLDTVQPAFDGPHELTTRAYDAHGQMTISAARTVTVSNAAATKYLATYGSTTVPQAVAFDPTPGATQQSQPVDVTVTNKSGTAWATADVVLRYRWLRPDGSVAATGADVALTTSLAAGASRVMRVPVLPPALPDGVDKAQFVLRMDMYDKPTAAFFSGKGTKPLDNPVIVNKTLKATALGLERYYQYEGQPAGAGMSHLTNVANGNSLLRWTPFDSPGRGLATVVGLTYNSLEDKSESPVGNNFSLSISSLTRLGLPLDIHPNKADELALRTAKYIQLTDGDGTTHRFTQNAAGGWDEPAGVHLYLRQYSTTDLSRKWALTRPDRTTFFYNDGGFPTFVQDKNGNTLSFAYEDIPSGDDPGGVKKRVTAVTDAAGQGATPAQNRRFVIDYYSKNEARKPQIRGKIETIKDHNGSTLAFDYYEDGNLLSLTQKGGTKADGSFLPDRSFVFTYTTSAGDAAAITAPSARVNPDPKTPNQSTRLFSVRDPRGAETTFTYFGPTSGQDRWKLKSRTDRGGSATSFLYDNAATATTVTAPLGRATKYDYDSAGLVQALTDPKGQTTNIAWSADRHVTKVTEPGGAFTEFAYNANGYLTDQWDQLRNHVVLTYDNLAVDANDVLTKWKSGRQIPHISQLKSRTDARNSVWSYGYDPKGNVTTVTEPEGSPAFQTVYAYNADGTVASMTDADGNVTALQQYDANGLPTKVTDAASGVTTFGYDDDGLLRWVQDPNHAAATGGDPRTYRSYFDYDSFHRLGRQSTPKHTEGDAPLIWSAADLDANDNVVKRWAPEEGHQFIRGDASVAVFDPMDRLKSSTNPDGETTTFGYDAAGRLEVTTLPKGKLISGSDKDYATFHQYDALDRLIRRSRYETDAAGAIVKSLHTHFCFDLAGDLRRVTGPRAAVDTVDCTAATPPPHTSTYEYDAAHRLKASVDPLGHRRAVTYDPNGNVETTTDEEQTVVTRTYDKRNLLTKVTEPLVKGAGGRDLVTKLVYDGTGNVRKRISPRAWDASVDKQTFTHYVTSYDYDGLNRLRTVTLPTDQRDAAPYYVHRSYDGNGNLLWTSLPTSAATPADVAADKKTTMTYYDTGWVRTSHDAGNHAQNPTIAFDYWPEGWQRSRTPAGGSPELWTYEPDGMLREHFDRRGQKVVYDYDDDNMLVSAKDRSGLVDPTQKAVEVEVAYDTLDRVRRTRYRPEGSANWTFSTFDYDLGSNLVERGADGEETATGVLVTEPRRTTFTYDAADWLDVQNDFGKPGVTSDDMTIDNSFTDAGREKERVVKGPDGTAKQTTQWGYFANGALKTLVTRSGGPSGPILEQHTVDYLDDDGIYVNGNRTKDSFLRKGPDGTDPCRATECVERFVYDAREKLVGYRNGRGGEVTYALDPAGNVDVEKTFANGVLSRTKDYDYSGNRLTALSVDGAADARYLYDSEGNLDCITRPGFTGAACPVDGADLVSDYSYDYLNRLLAYKSYQGGGALDDDASYVYDALDRVVRQSESHGASPARTTELSYLGLTSLVSSEKQAQGTTGVTDKTYGYDAYGHRISMTNDPAAAGAGGKAGTFTYGYDVHGSVSLLLDQAGTATASYGYTPYGTHDDQLTTEPSEGGTSSDNPLNGYRYTGKRLDTGSGTLDMGARRFGPDTGRFLQQDQLAGVTSDVALSTDPLTQNRYSLAGGNPVSFVEWDGHMPVDEPEGNAGSAETEPAETETGTLGSRLAEEIGAGDPPGSPGGGAGGTPMGLDSARDSLLSKEPPAAAPPPLGLDAARERLLADGPRMLPGQDGLVPCEDMPGGSVKDYLSGRACPPPGFPYDPVVKVTDAGPRTLDPFNDGCSFVPESASYFDFTDACLMHDYGYDLKRFGVDSFKRWDIDQEMLEVSLADCEPRNFLDRIDCKAQAYVYKGGLDIATTRYQDSVDGDITTSPGPSTRVTW